MVAASKLVDQAARPAPYADDVRAKGWRFELDYERIEQSDTWALADPELRPWLLMLWLTAWKQRPCGSLPDEDELIAARIGMPVSTFRANRDVLMRGWWRADDGRLYHSTIVDLAIAMIGVKTSERDRKRAYRERVRAHVGVENVPPDNHGTTAGLPPVVRTPEPEPEPEPETTKSPDGDSSPARAERPAKRSVPQCPFDAIVEAYHAALPHAPRVIAKTPGRRRGLSTRWREDSDRQDLEWWKRLFKFASKSDFLTGKAPGRDGGRPFVIGFDFFLAPKTLARLIEGYYHDAA